MSESSGELVMDVETTAAFQRVYDEIKSLQCAERGIQIAKIEQKMENGEKVEEQKHKKKVEKLTLYRVLMAVGVFAIGLVTVLNSLGVFK